MSTLDNSLKITISAEYAEKSFGKIYAILIALLLPLMMYQAPIFDFGMSTALVAVSMIWAGLVILIRFQNIRFDLIWPILLYFLYAVLKNSGVMILLGIACMVHIVAISAGGVDSKTLRKTMELVAILASCIVLFQTLWYYVTGVHIPMIYFNGMMDDMMESYGVRVMFGAIGNGLYRPSAFFLEPAHFSEYCSMALASVFFREEVSIPKAVLISAGIIATTSGMGIVLVAALWGMYFLVLNSNATIEKKVTNTLVMIVVVAIVLFALTRIDSFNAAVGRLFSTDDSRSALEGRTFWWDTYIANRSAYNWVFGAGINSVPDVYFTGFMALLYGYGLVGTAFFFLSLVVMFFRTKSWFVRTLLIMYGGLTFGSDNTAFLFVITNYALFLSSLVEDDERIAMSKRGVL